MKHYAIEVKVPSFYELEDRANRILMLANELKEEIGKLPEMLPIEMEFVETETTTQQDM